VSFYIFGHSCGVENELNCQRDIVHVARLTVARTAAQANPPVCVPTAHALPAYRQVVRATRLARQALGAVPPGGSGLSKRDWSEAANLLFPAAKAHVVVVSGTLRSFQKLVGAIADTGKEAEFRNVLWLINNNLHGLLPDMFAGSSTYGCVC
jgi:hypothetical protein